MKNVLEAEGRKEHIAAMTASAAFYRIAQIEFDIRQLVHNISESRAAGKDVTRMHAELDALRRELVKLQMQELLEPEAA